MIFKSRGNPTHSQYSIYYLVGINLLATLLCLLVGAYCFATTPFWSLVCMIVGPIAFVRKIIAVIQNYGRRKVTEMEVGEDEIKLSYFHKHLTYGERQISRSDVRIFYEAHEGKDYLHSLKIVHPDGTPYFLENKLEMWNEDSLDEIFAMVKAMDYPVEVV